MAPSAAAQAPRLRIGRVLAVYLVAGAALGAVVGLLGRLGAPDAVRAALAALAVAGIVATAPVLNRLARTGRAPWLVRGGR